MISITIEIKGEKFTLTKEEARALQEELNELMPTKPKMVSRNTVPSAEDYYSK